MKFMPWVVFASLAAATLLGSGLPAKARGRQSGPPDNAAFIRLMVAENGRNVGQTLPSDIQVTNDQGKVLDLRAVLHGPVVLLRVQPHCPPCDQLLDYVRDHAIEYRRTKKSRSRSCKPTLIAIRRYPCAKVSLCCTQPANSSKGSPPVKLRRQRIILTAS
ncbi:MAG: hypothetical protein EPN74_16690 [Rhodanobacter sp.]|nr:MAG: hypothetical protein EPN74_16690 [Rhodanobacter sp.]